MSSAWNSSQSRGDTQIGNPMTLLPISIPSPIPAPHPTGQAPPSIAALLDIMRRMEARLDASEQRAFMAQVPPRRPEPDPPYGIPYSWTSPTWIPPGINTTSSAVTVPPLPFTAVFDSLEATLPPNSRERLAVEQVWLGREIADIVAAEGENRQERHERFRSWEMMMRSAGFCHVALSPFALSQAKLLLRLHYPSEGYQLHILNDSFFLGWQNQPLFAVSSWR